MLPQCTCMDMRTVQAGPLTGTVKLGSILKLKTREQAHLQQAPPGRAALCKQHLDECMPQRDGRL